MLRGTYGDALVNVSAVSWSGSKALYNWSSLLERRISWGLKRRSDSKLAVAHVPSISQQEDREDCRSQERVLYSYVLVRLGAERTNLDHKRTLTGLLHGPTMSEPTFFSYKRHSECGTGEYLPSVPDDEVLISLLWRARVITDLSKSMSNHSDSCYAF